VLLLILTGISIIGYYSMHGAGPVALTSHLRFYLPTITWEWLVFGYIYWGVRRHGKAFRDIAGERWKSGLDVLRDIGIAFAAWIVAIVVLGVTSHLLHATGSLEAAKRLAPQGVLESVVWIGLSVTAGVCEETIFRGYFQRQFVAWFRNVPAGVVVSAILFGAGHLYQGWRPAIVIVVFGLLFGILAEARRNIRPGILLHTWQDGISGFLVRFLSRAVPK
jgi:membrane protease YdiL (CAAX protease family)